MHKRYLTSLGLFLSLALLVGAFLIVPKPSLARAPYTPITVTQPGQCTPMQAGTTSPPTNYQTCIVAVSIAKDYSNGVHFSVSYSDRYCAYTCNTTTEGMTVATPEGTNITKAAYPVHVLLIGPYYEMHGYDSMTFVFHGPSNSITLHMTAQSCC